MKRFLLFLLAFLIIALPLSASALSVEVLPSEFGENPNNHYDTDYYLMISYVSNGEECLRCWNFSADNYTLFYDGVNLSVKSSDGVTFFYDVFDYSYSTSSWSYFTSNGVSSTKSAVLHYIGDSLTDYIFYSSSSILDTRTNEVFRPAPQPTLPKVVQPKMLVGVMNQVLTMIPIGLTCLISFLALRKGLATLHQILYLA